MMRQRNRGPVCSESPHENPRSSRSALIEAMNPESLKLNEGTMLIRIMRRKAERSFRVLR
jgi:hypothetical protein